MNTNPALESARTQLDTARAAYEAVRPGVEARIDAAVSTAELDAADAELKPLKDAFDVAQRKFDTLSRGAEARNANPLLRSGIGADFRVSEPATYDRRNTQVDYFSDLYAFQKAGSQEALARLQRNNQEVAAERGLEGRASITTSDFYPPIWASQQYVTTMRPRLVFGALVQQLDLPTQGETVTIPKYVAPTDAANFQAGDNSAVTTNAGSTSQLTAPVCLAAGFLDIARQALERTAPGLSEVVFSDISRDIAHKIESGCLNGSGTNAPLGILQDGGVPAVTVSAQTAVQFLLKTADLIQRVEVATGEPADFILMHSRRFSWLASLVDSNNRPLISPSGSGPFNAFGTLSPQGLGSESEGLSLDPNVTPKGYMLGLPIYTSPSIPVTNGSGTNEDWVVVGVRSLAARWSDPAGIRQFSFEGVVSSTASVRLQALTYSTYITRYPSAFGLIKGMTTPGF